MRNLDDSQSRVYNIGKTNIDIYIVTGTKNLRIPEGFCEECNLFVNAAKKAADDLDIPINVNVYSWWTHFPVALKHGGYHPPVMIIGGKKLCQGHEVPSKKKIKERVLEVRKNKFDRIKTN